MIDADIHFPIMEVPPEDRRDREKVNYANPTRLIRSFDSISSPGSQESGRILRSSTGDRRLTSSWSTHTSPHPGVRMLRDGAIFRQPTP